jgi:alpha-aminoadipic semialdehyde synthase
VECTVRATQPDNPVYVYNPADDSIKDGFDGKGVAILPIDNFPCELAREASIEFGDVLYNYIPEIAQSDFSKPIRQLQLSDPIRKSLIVHKGQLTPDFQYLEDHL